MPYVKRFSCVVLLLYGLLSVSCIRSADDDFLAYKVNPQKDSLKLYWKDDQQQIFKSLGRLKTWLESKHKTLVFATNAGMYKTDHSSLGLFIQDGKLIAPLNRRQASGNFYWQPNGVLYVDVNNKAVISKIQDFVNNGKIKYATQSGPMLVFDGHIHPEFKQGSTNINIRNGVGILPNNELVFIMSKKEVNLYDFAQYFKSLGCKEALSFDGFVCRTYLPQKNWQQTDGDFGVIIGVEKSQK